MVMAMILMGFYNIILAVLFYHFIYDDIIITLAYYFITTPLTGVITYDWLVLATQEIKSKQRFEQLPGEEKEYFKQKRQSLLDRLSKLGVQ